MQTLNFVNSYFPGLLNDTKIYGFREMFAYLTSRKHQRYRQKTMKFRIL